MRLLESLRLRRRGALVLPRIFLFFEKSSCKCDQIGPSPDSCFRTLGDVNSDVRLNLHLKLQVVSDQHFCWVCMRIIMWCSMSLDRKQLNSFGSSKQPAGQRPLHLAPPPPPCSAPSSLLRPFCAALIRAK